MNKWITSLNGTKVQERKLSKFEEELLSQMERLQEKLSKVETEKEQLNSLVNSCQEEIRKYKEANKKAIEYIKDFIFEPLTNFEDRKLIMCNQNLKNFEDILKVGEDK